MITRLVWTIWTPKSDVPKKAIKLNYSLTHLVEVKAWWHQAIASTNVDILPLIYLGNISVKSESIWKTQHDCHKIKEICVEMGRVRLKETWWCHQMETFSALLAICSGNSPVTGEFPTQRPVTCSFDVFFDLRLNKRLSKQLWGWWFETPLHPLWRRCNGMGKCSMQQVVMFVQDTRC